jgi:hypothetical protein
MKKLIRNLFTLFLLFCSIGLYSLNENIITYGSEEYGIVELTDTEIGFNFWGEKPAKYPYTSVEKEGLTFFNYADKKTLMLMSEDLLFMYNPKIIFEGVGHKRGRGSLTYDAISPAHRYSSSSFLTEKNKKYQASNLSYQMLDNPWVEGVEGAGIGEYIDMEWEFDVSGLFIFNGYISYDKPELFKKNNRVKTIIIYPDDKKDGYTFVLEDTPNPQKIKFEFNTQKMRLKILDVYQGSQWNDTCLSLVFGISSTYRDVF